MSTAPPAIARLQEDEEDTARHRNSQYDPQHPRIGKEKEHSSALHFSQDPSSRPAAYPPLNDEQEESRRIQENLKRWEQAELQRRKAARQSSITASPTSPSSLVDSVSRRASLLWPAGKRTSTAAGGGGRTNSVSYNLGRHTALPSTDELPLTTIAASPTPSPSRSEINLVDGSSNTNTHSDKHVNLTPTFKSLEQLEDPFNPPEELALSLSSPFADPPATPGADQTSALAGGDPSASTPTTPTFDSIRGDGNLPANSYISRQPPPPRPLGLPRPKTPPPPLDSPGVKDDDDDDDDGFNAAVKTRWWHEWLCGCGEGSDRGGDHQAGRTNPFE